MQASRAKAVLIWGIAQEGEPQGDPSKRAPVGCAVKAPTTPSGQGHRLTSSQKPLELSSEWQSSPLEGRANPHCSPNQGPQGEKRPPMTSTRGWGAAGYRTPGAVGKRGSESPVDMETEGPSLREEREGRAGPWMWDTGPRSERTVPLIRVLLPVGGSNLTGRSQTPAWGLM